MKFNWIRRASELEKEGKPFAIATVIDTIAPTSAKPMAKAIITSDGKMEGWIGGGCAQDTVIEEALECIQEGMASVIRLSPEKSIDGNLTYKKEIFLTCESGGTLEFHIEPVLPMTKLAIYGNTPTVSALAKLGLFLDFDVIVFSNDTTEIELDHKITKINKFSIVEDGPCMAVVATQGNGDLSGLKAAINSKPEYLSLIASKKKSKSLLDRLKKQGFKSGQIASIKFPAGLDIGAVTPEEIAVSIMAELVQSRRASSRRESINIETKNKQSDKEKDPICGMYVDPLTADYSSFYENITYYFCCGGCKDKFEEEPSSYIQI